MTEAQSIKNIVELLVTEKSLPSNNIPYGLFASQIGFPLIQPLLHKSLRMVRSWKQHVYLIVRYCAFVSISTKTYPPSTTCKAPFTGELYTAFVYNFPLLNK